MNSIASIILLIATSQLFFIISCSSFVQKTNNLAFHSNGSSSKRYLLNTNNNVAKKTTTNASKRRNASSPSSFSALQMSLKPAAIPLMDSGKALARSGELLIDLTSRLDLYGGALSAAGAHLRNGGDNIAQAAASCRFKTGYELVYDELRQGADQLMEATAKFESAEREAVLDEDKELSSRLAAAAPLAETCRRTLEAAGAGIMMKEPLPKIGQNLVMCGQTLQQLSTVLGGLAPELEESKVSGQRMAYAADRMVLAGNNLQGISEKPKGGKAWLKGGL